VYVVKFVSEVLKVGGIGENIKDQRYVKFPTISPAKSGGMGSGALIDWISMIEKLVREYAVVV
jgi:hypothetical protein